MSLPASGKLALAAAYAGVIANAIRIKNQTTALNSASSITRRTVLDYANFLADSLDLLNSYTAMAGLTAYARTELNDNTIDIVSEYNTTKTQIVATQDWMVANFPGAPSALAVYAFDGNKRFTDINLTAGQLSQFKSQLAALLATIN